MGAILSRPQYDNYLIVKPLPRNNKCLDYICTRPCDELVFAYMYEAKVVPIKCPQVIVATTSSGKGRPQLSCHKCSEES